MFYGDRVVKTTSSSQYLPTARKLAEAWQQLKRLVRQRAPWKTRSFEHLEADFVEYDAICRNLGGFSLENARAFEIGCGQRPYRLFYLLAKSVDVRGIDLDRVFIEPGWQDVRATFRDNGAERAFKTCLRYLLFDRSENVDFRAFLSDVARRDYKWPKGRIKKGSAADQAMWAEGPFDFVYSEDVFEHIPVELLSVVCDRLADSLTHRGLALVRPMIFTGLQGGHNVEWYDAAAVHLPKACEPWDHLRQNRFPANTYLNRISISQYREIFQNRFEIIEERVRYPRLGEKLLTPELRAELSIHSDEDLFSNQVGFILRVK